MNRPRRAGVERVAPFPAKSKRERALPWSDVLARTGITRRTPLCELPELLTLVEAASWLGLGRDGAYMFARARGKRVGRRLLVPRRVLEDLVAGE